jgi:HrpA-like RNA helicase
MDESGDHFGLVSVYDDWCAEKSSSSFSELIRWCSKKHLQNRALMMAKDIKDQLSEILYKLKPSGRIEAIMDKEMETYCFGKDLDKRDKRSHDLRFCLSQSFFMNTCRSMPNQKNEGSYISIKDGLHMRLDQNSALKIQGHIPDWLIFTEATGSSSSESTCIMRTASALNPHWIQEKLKLLKQVNIDQLCGRDPR